MRIGPLTLFVREHSNGTPLHSFLLAALHWRWSLTWRWSVSWSPPNKHVRQGPYFIRTRRGMGINFIAGLNMPIFGCLHISTQPNMRRKP